jgi:hypothetical protein
MDTVVTATSTAVHISSIKPSIPGPSLTAKPIEGFPQKRHKLETGTHALLSSTSSSSEAQGQASSSSAGAEPPAEEENEELMAAYILKAGLSRLLQLFKDKRTGDLMDDAERKMLIDELMSYLFSSVTKTRIGFTMGEDPAQPGGFRGEIVFKPSLQQKLPGVATKHTANKKVGKIVYSFEGLPDVVGLSCSGPKKSISFVIEMKSIDEPAECGIGQLLISTMVAALKHKMSVIAIQMHPQAISVYRVYLKNGEDKQCCIECLYRKIESRLSYS